MGIVDGCIEGLQGALLMVSEVHSRVSKGNNEHQQVGNNWYCPSWRFSIFIVLSHFYVRWTGVRRGAVANPLGHCGPICGEAFQYWNGPNTNYKLYKT